MQTLKKQWLKWSTYLSTYLNSGVNGNLVNNRLSYSVQTFTPVQAGVFRLNLSGSKSPQLSRTLFRILTDFNSVLVLQRISNNFLSVFFIFFFLWSRDI